MLTFWLWSTLRVLDRSTGGYARMSSPAREAEDFQEFELLVSTGRDYLGLYLRMVAVYFAVLGVALKLLFDAKLGSLERQAFFWFGVVVNISAIGLTALGAKAYSRLARRCDDVAKTLHRPNPYFPAAIAAARGVLVMISLFSVLWFLLWNVL